MNSKPEQYPLKSNDKRFSSEEREIFKEVELIMFSEFWDGFKKKKTEKIELAFQILKDHLKNSNNFAFLLLGR